MQRSFFRRCITCKESKLLTDFPTQPGEHGGRHYQCKACHQIKKKEWEAKNPEKRKAQRQREREKNKERYATYLKEWRQKNRDRFRAYLNNRKNRLKDSRVEPNEWLAILEKHNHQCFYCGVSGKLTQDHWIPLARGGEHIASNLVPACQKCNRKKHTMTGDEYLAKIKDQNR